MQVSVVIAAWNGASVIGHQLDALARQQWHAPWEIVVADNGSRDGTRAVVAEYRARLANLRLVDASARSGLTHARNVGARAALGESLLFLDQDDEAGSGWLAAMGDALQRHDLVAGRLEHDRLNETRAIAVRGRPQSDGLILWRLGTYHPFAFGCTIGIRRSLHESVGGWDEDFTAGGEDLDYCWRLYRAGATLEFVPAAVVHYRSRHELSDLYRQARAYGEAEVLVYKKHRPLGLPAAPHPWRTGARGWLGLARRFALAWDEHQRALAAWNLGLRVGLARGTLKHRVVLL